MTDQEKAAGACRTNPMIRDDEPMVEPNTNPKKIRGQIYPGHSHGLMNVAPSRGAKMIALKNYSPLGRSCGPTHGEPKAMPWVYLVCPGIFVVSSSMAVPWVFFGFGF
jgi:hypothetical protein